MAQKKRKKTVSKKKKTSSKTKRTTLSLMPSVRPSRMFLTSSLDTRVVSKEIEFEIKSIKKSFEIEEICKSPRDLMLSILYTPPD